MYETKEDYERLRKQFIEQYGIDEATEEFFQVLYKKRLQYHLIIAVLSSLVLLLLVLRLLEMRYPQQAVATVFHRRTGFFSRHSI